MLIEHPFASLPDFDLNDIIQPLISNFSFIQYKAFTYKWVTFHFDFIDPQNYEKYFLIEIKHSIAMRNENDFQLHVEVYRISDDGYVLIEPGELNHFRLQFEQAGLIKYLSHLIERYHQGLSRSKFLDFLKSYCKTI